MWNLINKLNQQGKWGQAHRWRAGRQLWQRGVRGVERLSKKDKGLMDMDNSVVIVEVGVYKGTKW